MLGAWPYTMPRFFDLHLSLITVLPSSDALWAKQKATNANYLIYIPKGRCIIHACSHCGALSMTYD